VKASEEVSLTISMPRGGWDAVMRALEAAAADEEDESESVRLQDALLLMEDALEDITASDDDSSTPDSQH